MDKIIFCFSIIMIKTLPFKIITYLEVNSGRENATKTILDFGVV